SIKAHVGRISQIVAENVDDLTDLSEIDLGLHKRTEAHRHCEERAAASIAKAIPTATDGSGTIESAVRGLQQAGFGNPSIRTTAALCAKAMQHVQSSLRELEDRPTVGSETTARAIEKR